MSESNGTATAPASRKEIRQRLRLIQEQRALRELEWAERRDKLHESFYAEGDWLKDYLDVITNNIAQGWRPVGVGGRQSRRWGRHFPLFQTEEELRLLREPARILTATNPYAIGLLEGLCSYVIGTGYGYKFTIPDAELYPGLVDAVQRVIDDFLIRNQFGSNDDSEMRLADVEYDAGEQMPLEEEAFFRTCVDGEFIARQTFNESDGTSDVRVIEPDQLTSPHGANRTKPAKDERQWLFGILTDDEDEQIPKKYYIQWGDTVNDGDEHDPKEITHVKVNSWRTVKRGLTDFCFDTLDTLKLATILRGNLGEAASQRASIVGVRQHAQGTKEAVQSFADGNYDYQRRNAHNGQLESVKRYIRGRWEDLAGGLEYANGPGAGNDVSHLAVLQGLLRAAAVRWCGTEWLASGDSSNNNYASSLVANNHFVIAVKRRQKRLRFALCKMVIRALVHYLAVKGKVTGESRDEQGNRNPVTYPADMILRYGSITVEVPSPESADPLQQAQRYAIERQNGVLDPITWAQKAGYDPDTVQKNFDKWREMNPTADVPLSLPLGGGFDGTQNNNPNV